MTSNSPRNPISVVINRPHGDPVRLRVKGQPHMMEDGSVGLTCRDERNRTYWIAVTPDMLMQMTVVYEANANLGCGGREPDA